MPVRAQPGADRDAPFWTWAVCALLALPFAGLAVLTGLLWLMHDHYEIQAHPHFQLFAAASRAREDALASGGRFRAESEPARAIVGERDPWDHPFRFEILDDDGRHARVFSLGHDDRPGGEGCDADIVWWIDMHGATSTWDVGVPPEAWVEAGWGVESDG